MRIAVVGAGIAGLVTLQTIQSRFTNIDKFQDNLDIVAYERGDEVGGEWVLSDKSEINSTVRSSIYSDMQTNIPAPVMQLHPDLPWPLNMRAFPYQHEYLSYIQSFCDQFNLAGFIQFATFVNSVERCGDHLLIEVSDLKSGKVRTEKFDFVFLCAGKHNLPYIPTDVDTSQFSGMKLHYHDLKDPERLHGKRVLIIGSSFGAMDMAILLPGKVQKLYIAWHDKRPFWYNDSLENVFELKPKMIKTDSKSVLFADGSLAEVDVILYCTGFRHLHPLEGDLSIDVNEMGGLFPAYKHVVHPSCPNLFFVGKGFGVINHAFRLQAEFACAIMGGRVVVPTKEDMLLDIEQFRSKWRPKFETMFDGDFSSYLPVIEAERELGNYLSAVTDCQPIDDYVLNLCYATFNAMKSDVLNFKNYQLVDRNDVDPKRRNYFRPPES